jgi:hypothetical protein
MEAELVVAFFAFTERRSCLHHLDITISTAAPAGATSTSTTLRADDDGTTKRATTATAVRK